MNSIVYWFEELFASLPLSFLDIWGRFGYIVGLFLMICAYGGFTFNPGGKFGFGRRKQSWDTQAFLSIPFTFVFIFITGYVGSFIVLVPGAQTFESLKDLTVFLCILLFGYPALLAVPFAYGLSDLIEGVPPDFLFDWLLGYFINPACFWVAYQLIGRDPDFKKLKTWILYSIFVIIFMSIEPQLWGYICSEQFTREISYRNITPALFFTTGVTWIVAPFAMLIALPLAKKYGLFWAEIPGHTRELVLSYKEWYWQEEKFGKDGVPLGQGLPIRMFLVTPFILLVLIMVAATAYLTLRSSEAASGKLAARLHQEISENINLRLDDYLARSIQKKPEEVSLLLKNTNIARHGRAFIVDRETRIVASSDLRFSNIGSASESGDPVIRNSILSVLKDYGDLYSVRAAFQFRFDIVTAKPVSRETWLTQVTPYRDNAGENDWIVITAMPASYYLEGVQIGNSESAKVFAVALTLSLLIAAFLAGIVTSPIRNISQATRAMAAGDFSQRVPSSKLEEIGTLAFSFNHMAEQLQEAFRRTKASEEQYKDLVDTTPGVVWEADAITFNFTFVSKQAEDLLGYSVEEWKTPGFWADHIHPEDKDYAVNYCVACTGRLEAHDFEYRFLKKDGTVIWLRDMVKVITEGNREKWLRGVMVDITERKNIEEKFLERNRFVESILDISPDILYIYDIQERRNVYSNIGVERLLGYSVEEIQIMGNSLLKSLMHPDDYQVYLTDIIPRYLNALDRDVIEHQYRMHHKDRKWRWFVSRELIYKRDFEGIPTQIFGISNDITKSKEAEETILDLNANLERKIDQRTEELKRTNKDLTESLEYQKKISKELNETQSQLLLSEKLAALGQLAAGMTHELNTPLGAIVSSNRAILDILYEEVKEIPDLLLSLNKTEVEHFKFLLDESLKEISQAEILPNRSLRRELVRVFKEASVSDPENAVNMILELGIHRLGEKLPELLKTENSLKILNAVSSIASIVRFSNVISIATGKASYVVDALKNYLNPGAHNGDEELVPVDIEVELETIIALYHNKIKYGVEVIKHYRTNELCLGDPDKLNQVWINLLNNGLQAMNYKGKIEISTEKRESWIIVSFMDSGSGISKEIQDKIFDPFFTTKNPGEGIGLGLDICKKIVEKMGGKIEFESEPGRTKFEVWLKSANRKKEESIGN
ncbi:PAS domain-containing protein [Leptospira saintgironsiae]|uniref:histidine kinase n=1 Tax=Leptospira saintgironsiae TaxID=2023183 RepID=A0A2M9YHT6_9LEPT|nr:PAS domain-containing protein [Leptospira saintgironsiae]PJZ51054.1 PAS domain-containing sensor histidine kinase [Leptospira saintgironsiae]